MSDLPEEVDYIEPPADGTIEPGNIDLNNRQRVPVEGGYATVRSMSFGTDKGEVLIPTVADGKELSPEEAIDRYDRTGEHLGIFRTPAAADAYAEQLHRDQAARYDDPETEARRQGYSWPEIKDYTARATSTALQQGYSGREIDDFLGFKNPTAFEDRARAGWLSSMAADENIDPIEPADSPTVRWDYAAALLDGEVKGPGDFSYRYAAAGLDAAHNGMGLDDSNAQAVQERQAQGAFAADALAAELPTREDLTDATLALTANDREADHDQVRRNLMDHWRDTGQDPVRAAMQATNDPELRDDLTAAREPGAVDGAVQALFRNAGIIGDFYKQEALGVGRAVTSTVIGLGHITDAAFSAVADMTGSDTLQAAAKDYTASWDALQKRFEGELKGADWSEAGKDPSGFVGGVLGEAIPTIAEYMAVGIPAMIVYGTMHGADAAFRETGSWAASAAGALIGGAAAGAPAPFLHGAAGKGLIDNAVRGAVGMGLVGGIQSVADGVPRAIASGDWNEISFAGIPEGVVKGAIGGALIGTFGGVQQMRAKVVDSSKPPGETTTDVPAREALADLSPADAALHDEARAMAELPEADRAAAIAKAREPAAEGEEPPANMPDPKQVQELAAGYSTANGVLRFVKGLMGDLLTNTEGSVPRSGRGEIAALRSKLKIPEPGKDQGQVWGFDPETGRLAGAEKPIDTRSATEQTQAETEAAALRRRVEPKGTPPPQAVPKPPPPEDTRTNRDIVRDTLRQQGGLGEQEIIHFGKMIDATRVALNPHMPEWIDANKSGQGMLQTAIGHAIRAFEGKSFTFDENGKRQVVKFDKNDPLKPVFDTYGHINEAIHELAQQRITEGKLDAVGYVKDYWAHLWEDPNAALEAWHGSGGGQGRSAGFKERAIPTIEDGLNLGLKLKIVDPGDLMLYDVSSKIKFLHHLDTMDRLEKLGIVVRSVGDRLPFPNAERIVGRSTERVTPDGVEYAWAPKGAARLYNNALSQGWYAYPSTGTAFQKLMWLKNTSVATKMIVPLFHSFVIAEQTLATGAQQVMSELRAGNFSRAAVEAARTIAIAPKAKDIAVAGYKAMQDYANMTGEPVVQGLVEGGARFGKRQLPYQTGDAGYHTLIAQNKGHVIEAAVRELRREATSTLGKEGENILTKGALFVPRVAGVGVVEMGRLTTMTSAPLFDHIIPVMKAGSAMLRAQQFLRLNPEANPEAVQTRMRQIVDNIEDRFGEMNQDNLFWNKWTKQTANLAAISTSWAYGTWRWLAAGSGYSIERGREWNPEATSSLIGAVAVYAGANAIMTAINTGTPPRDVWDFLNFRTGGVTKTGAPQRGLLPTEFKELYDMGKIVANALVDPMSVPQGLAHYIAGKENPVFQAFTALLTGEDALGHKISDTPGGWRGYFMSQIKPILFNNISADPPGTGLNKFERLFIREAPSWVEDPQAYHAQQVALHDRWTKEELARARKEALAAGEEPPAGSKPGRAELGGSASGGARGGSTGSGFDAPRIAAQRANPSFYGYAPQPTFQPQQYAPQPTEAGPTVYRGSGGRTAAAPRPTGRFAPPRRAPSTRRQRIR